MRIFTIGDLHLSLYKHKPMDIFGPNWTDHDQRIREEWIKIVKEEDVVVIAGDFSWAMRLEEALPDFQFLDALPGQKLILKGNHDYWWTGVTKMTAFLRENGLNTISFLHNNAYTYGNISICGTRGWMCNSDQYDENDEKILAREVNRLNASLAAAGEDTEKIVFLHYPPVYDYLFMQPMIEAMQEADVKRCYYGHLHDKSIKKAATGPKFGIHFRLISADYLDFTPELVAEVTEAGECQ